LEEKRWKKGTAFNLSGKKERGKIIDVDKVQPVYHLKGEEKQQVATEGEKRGPV